MSQIAIHAEGLSKRYVLGGREPLIGLRHVLTDLLKAPLRSFRRRAPVHLWALRDVSFDVQEGEVVGLIGRNGAGKTTLLKLLARITRPTAGYAEIRGRVGSLLEVGTGFHAELTGRENIYLSGAILGMSKREIERKFDEIVAFAEVEKFIDTPVKHYSGGMHTRLAFAVAAHLEPDILLVDEVLAVGDLQFQKKCLGKMSEVARGGRTILFVSHQLNQIRRLCEKVMWVDAGGVREMGPTAQVAAAYESAMSSGKWGDERPGAQKARARFLSWEVVEPRTEQPNLLSSLGPVSVRFSMQVNEPVRIGHHGIALYNNEGQLIWGWATNNLELGVGAHEFCYAFPMLPLRPGPYTWQVSLYDERGLVDVCFCVPEMIVATEVHQHPLDECSGLLNVPCRFAIQQKE